MAKPVSFAVQHLIQRLFDALANHFAQMVLNFRLVDLDDPIQALVLFLCCSTITHQGSSFRLASLEPAKTPNLTSPRTTRLFKCAKEILRYP